MATPLMAATVAASLLLAGALFDLRDKPVIRELSYLTSRSPSALRRPRSRPTSSASSRTSATSFPT